MQGVHIEKLNVAQLKNKKVFDWPIWEKEPEQFNWFYEENEHCYIIEGVVVVSTPHETYEIKAGDFVTFPKGLQCVWDVKETIRKQDRCMIKSYKKAVKYL